jgi:hypothetical protein
MIPFEKRFVNASTSEHTRTTGRYTKVGIIHRTYTYTGLYLCTKGCEVDTEVTILWCQLWQM